VKRLRNSEVRFTKLDSSLVLDPDRQTETCVALREGQSAALQALIEAQRHRTRWYGDDLTQEQRTDWVDDVIARLQDGTCEAEQPEENDACFEIGAYHPAIEYWPNHPILSPDYHPDNFSAPIWITGAGSIGLTASDAIINPLSIMTPVILTEHWSIGLPSIRLHFSGAGEIDLKFIDAIQGGMVLIFPDGNPLVGNLISLNHVDFTDITDLPSWIADILEFFAGGPVFEVDHEFTFTTSGPHTLTMWFIPLGDEPPFLGFGGGLRNIELCGEIELDTEVVMPYTIVRAGCDIELKLDGVTVSTIEDVFYTDATCDITGITNIRFPFSGTANMLQLTNTFGTPSDNNGAAVLFRALDNAANQRLQASIIANWDSISLQEGQLRFAVGLAGATRNLMRLNSSNIAMTLTHDNTLGHTVGFRLTSLANVLTGGRASEILNFGRYIGGITWDGEMQAERRNTVTNAAQTASRLRAWADGVTPAAGFGVQLALEGQSSTTEGRAMARIRAAWATAADASRAAELSMRVSNYGGEVVAMRMGNNDGFSALAFHGVSPIQRPTHTAESEIDAINEINATLAAYGLIVDSTEVVPDSGGGGAVVEKSLIQEIYRDFREGPYGFSGFEPGDYAVWTPTVGWEPGTDGFRIFQNFSAGIEFIEVRVAFEYQFDDAQTMFLGFDWTQTSQLIIHEEELGPNVTPIATVWSYPVFTRPDTTAPLQFVVSSVFNPLEGHVTVTSIDIAVRGLASLESDNAAIEEDQIPPHRVVRYMDLTERVTILELYDWFEASGGSVPPTLEFEAQ